MTINGQIVEFIDGATILEIATAADIHIPTLCHRQGLTPTGGCGVCAVEEIDSGKIMPACATIAQESFDLSTASERVNRARIAALELLLSDHPADCEAPCQMACPSGLPVQSMLALVAAREWDAARKLAQQHPFVCGDRFSQTPCEKVCRRSKLGGPVAICAIHRRLCDDLSVEPAKRERSPHQFRSRMKGLSDAAMVELAAEQGVRIYSAEAPIDPELAVYAARRCLQCGCGKADNCLLRDLCGELGAQQLDHTGTQRAIVRESTCKGFHFDSSRCILCGLCERTAQKLGVKIGPACHGRGFAARIGPPLGRSWDDMELQTLIACADVCPTGAMVFEPTFGSSTAPQ